MKKRLHELSIGDLFSLLPNEELLSLYKDNYDRLKSCVWFLSEKKGRRYKCNKEFSDFSVRMHFNRIVYTYEFTCEDVDSMIAINNK